VEFVFFDGFFADGNFCYGGDENEWVGYEYYEEDSISVIKNEKQDEKEEEK